MKRFRLETIHVMNCLERSRKANLTWRINYSAVDHNNLEALLNNDPTNSIIIGIVWKSWSWSCNYKSKKIDSALNWTLDFTFANIIFFSFVKDCHWRCKVGSQQKSSLKKNRWIQDNQQQHQQSIIFLEKKTTIFIFFVGYEKRTVTNCWSLVKPLS